MPSFGEFETIGEPLSRSEEREHLSTVWQARKGGLETPLYVVKAYLPRRRALKPGQEDTIHLYKDPALQFLEGVKQVRQAIAEGGSNLAPIHDLGMSDSGAWYATDFFPRQHLWSYIDHHGEVDGPTLRHIFHEVVAGCLALKRSRGYSHGNLKAGNIFLAGKVRPLRQTTLVLMDAYPAAPLQLARLDPKDRIEVRELLHQVVEAHDLRAIGELILQLVEGRIFSRSEDYNYPVARSPAWKALGKDAAFWFDWCNKLLDPQLSLERANLEMLEAQVRPNSLLARFPKLLGGLAGEVASSFSSRSSNG